MNRPLPNTVDVASTDDALVLPADAIRRLKADYEADVRLFEELPARIKQKKRKYEAALLFAPPGFNPEAPVPAEELPPASPPEAPTPFELAPTPSGQEVDAEDGRVTWVGALEHILLNSKAGIAHKDALAQLKAVTGLPSSAGEKGFYNAVSRLEKRGRLIKSGGLLYSPKLVSELESRGERLPDVTLETRRRAGGAAAVVLDVLHQHPGGLTGPELRDAVRKLDGMPASLTKHGHYIYNVLSTLIGQGEVAKDANGIYKALRNGA